MDKVTYAYKYEPEWDLYTIRRIDGGCLNFTVPGGLVRQLVMEETMRTQDMVVVANVDRCISYSSCGELAVFDFKERHFEKKQVDEILYQISSETTEPKKKTGILQRLLGRNTK